MLARRSSNWGLFMKSMYMLCATAGVAVGCLFIAAGFIVAGQAPRPFGAPPVARDIGSAERYLTHVATDKPIYRTGEKLYVRGVVLRADGHSPMPQGSTGTARFEIKGPKGD